ncbi:hypothetical protein F2368_16690 [Salmonella enterica]|uniref:Uncharacterized protein n=1 Tax=Salmonella enterica subsp. enterica serovar Panama TaxID=29472 RepID=A0A5U8J655_SALET|nr:hypothetical protein [Salmonella enterica subsp. enterica serovar Panama]EBR8433084.1 hypothetical protein [Salmonella enterica subsp. enterica serovar Panama]EBW9460112.1 hypothetical protein [Salmonella enterica subsp. enterica serovar Panama]ECV2983035.1 hypothetical protein [Salmonella enterica]EEH7139339.1 hypothetical protein [Salmonella enterica]
MSLDVFFQPFFIVVRMGGLTNFIFCFSLLISYLLTEAIPIRGAKFKKPAWETKQAFCFSAFLRLLITPKASA